MIEIWKAPRQASERAHLPCLCFTSPAREDFPYIHYSAIQYTPCEHHTKAEHRPYRADPSCTFPRSYLIYAYDALRSCMHALAPRSYRSSFAGLQMTKSREAKENQHALPEGGQTRARRSSSMKSNRRRPSSERIQRCHSHSIRILCLTEVLKLHHSRPGQTGQHVQSHCMYTLLLHANLA